MSSSSKGWWRTTKRLVVVLIVATLVLGGYLAWVWSLRLQPGNRLYVVRPGMTLHQFLGRLHHDGLLPDAYSLLLLAHLEGKTRALQQGEYRFHPGITPIELLDQVVSGRTVEYPITFIEGWTFRQVQATLDAAPKLTHTLAGLSAQRIMSRLGHRGVNPEGRFYPDTYYYAAGTSDVTLLAHAYDRMQQFLDTAWKQRANGLPLKNETQALILASLIEKETAAPAERALIAGVFVNRLQVGMKLQTDPTVIYAMGARYHGAIHLHDLRLRSPYNTYRYYGLPPTPIAIPSPAAIEAALHPAHTQALYFVARGNGTHQFSETLREQDAAVIKYQLHGHKRPAARGARVDAAAGARR